MNMIIKLLIVSSFEDFRSLRSLYDRTETVVRGLKSIRTKPSSYGNFIMLVFIAKIPDKLRNTVSRNFGSLRKGGAIA